MTPLAHKLAKELVKPVKDRNAFWQNNRNVLNEALSDVHCFEATAVLPMLPMFKEQPALFGGHLFFLPAPKTWIEVNIQSHGRMAFLLEEEGHTARVTIFADECAVHVGSLSLVSDDVFYRGGRYDVPLKWLTFIENMKCEVNDFLGGLCAIAHSCLIVINSPKIINRKQHMPHKAIEKALLQANNGSYPLHAWTEILLKASVAYKDDSGNEHTAHLSGRKCLHFCRQHLRVQNGKLVLVSSHWRGDPALGIKRSRYVVH